MDASGAHRVIQNRRALYSFLQTQMVADEERADEKYQTGVLKSFVFEVDNFPAGASRRKKAAHIRNLFTYHTKRTRLTFKAEVLEEEGFYMVTVRGKKKKAELWVDTSTNPRFWLAYSLSEAKNLDTWLRNVATQSKNFDFIWLWPLFLEAIQARGMPRGFGLDYDYTKFAHRESEVTRYLKMQIWGGIKTTELYSSLKQTFGHEIILSRVRMKETNSGIDNFAMQSLGYSGKFNVRGTDFSVHNATLNHVRSRYEAEIKRIESCSLSWVERENGGHVLEGYALHFIPQDILLDLDAFYPHVFGGVKPFRLAGLPISRTNTSIITDVVDMHAGGLLRFELYPDLISVYLRAGTCGNSIARLYTNLQHYFGARFKVVSDNGIVFFE